MFSSIQLYYIIITPTVSYCVLNISLSYVPSGVVVRAAMVVGTKTNEVKTSKIFFFAQDKPGTSFLNNTIHLCALHTDVETPLL